MKKRRLFFLGRPKTGTTSLAHTMKKEIGAASMHHGPWSRWSQNHNKKGYLNSAYTVFTNATHDPDYEWLYETFPNSFFILQTRSLKDWVTSVWNHSKRKNMRRTDCHPLHNKLNKIQKDILKRNQYHYDIMNFFKDKENFCTLDLTHESEKSICKKLTIASQQEINKILHLHVTRNKKNYIKNPLMVKKAIHSLGIERGEYDDIVIKRLLNNEKGK